MFRAENTQSLLGLAVIMGLCWALSENRRVFPWRLAAGALLIQLLLVLGLFGLPPLRAVVAALGQGVEALAAATQTGVAFVFGFLAGGEGQPYGVSNPGALFVFAFRVLPVILVVCALAALLWHWGILKAVTRAFGLVFEKTMGLRGPPALAVGATIFMGQVEGPIFIRSYLARLSRSELFMLITVGMSCVAGSTMVAYATVLKDVLPNAAAHIITASVISAPAGVLLARILVPRDIAAEQSEPLETGPDKAYESSIDAVSRGVSDGLQIALNIGATLIVFVALAAIVNGLLGLLPDIAGAPLTLERILGVIFAPLVWLIGVPAHDAQLAGALLGVKLVLTEFTAFIQLGATPVDAIDPRTRVLMAYALCGFACGLLRPGARAQVRGHRHGLEGHVRRLPRHLPVRVHRRTPAARTLPLTRPNRDLP